MPMTLANPLIMPQGSVTIKQPNIPVPLGILLLGSLRVFVTAIVTIILFSISQLIPPLLVLILIILILILIFILIFILVTLLPTTISKQRKLSEVIVIVHTHAFKLFVRIIAVMIMIMAILVGFSPHNETIRKDMISYRVSQSRGVVNVVG